MEWTIPTQSLDVHKVKIQSPGRGHKLLVPLSYVDGEFRFPTLTLLLPSLPVKSYDATTGRLVLSLHGSNGTYSKFQALQEHIVATVTEEQRAWFPSERFRRVEELQAGFQPIVDHHALNLYCPLGTTTVPNEVQIYRAGSWSCSPTLPSNLFTTGTQLRIAVRIHGVAFHKHPITGGWTGKFRIQHRILAIFVGGS